MIINPDIQFSFFTDIILIFVLLLFLFAYRFYNNIFIYYSRESQNKNLPGRKSTALQEKKHKIGIIDKL